MITIVYKQSYNYHTKGIFVNKTKHIRLSLKIITSEITKIDCDDCNGTGNFIMPDGEYEVCVCCKGSGFIYINTI